MQTPRFATALTLVSLLGSFPLWSSAQTAAPASPATTAAPAATKPPLPPRTPEGAVTPAIKNENRHKEFLDRIQQGPVDLLFLGDSITDGWPRRGEWSWLKFAPYRPGNFGISGDRTEHVLWRIQNGELDGISPKLTVIMIGTNNIGQIPDEKPEWAAQGVKRIVEVVREKIPSSKILLLAVFPRGTKDSEPRAKVDEINKLIAKLDNGKTIRYLDIGNRFLDAAGELPVDVMPDKLHPTAKGYDIWYAAVSPTIDAMMK
ncbi:MAG: GDSL-type esterase/lipase family protein [Nibricoccus sp.]